MLVGGREGPLRGSLGCHLVLQGCQGLMHLGQLLLQPLLLGQTCKKAATWWTAACFRACCWGSP